MAKEVGSGGVAKEDEDRSTEKGVSLTLRGHKLIETRGRREAKDEIQLGLPGMAENIRTRASAGDESFKIVEHQQLKFHKGNN